MLDTATTQPRLPRNPRASYAETAQRVADFIALHGRRPATRCQDQAEMRLAARMVAIRASHPELAERFGLTAAQLETAFPRRVGGTPRLKGTIDVLATRWAREALSLSGMSMLKKRLVPSRDMCQSTSAPRLRAEVERDCWWFTLESRDFPDPRSWHELRMSGDCTLIVHAMRVAYLDFDALPDGAPSIRARRRVY